MRTTLTFEIDDAVDGGGTITDLRRALSTQPMYSALWEFDTYLRNRIKYLEPSKPTVRRVLVEVREELRKQLQDFNVLDWQE